MKTITNKLPWINLGNHAAHTEMQICETLMEKFPNEKLVALEVGSAYGGGVECIAKLFDFRGIVYGFDTFEGHPKDLAKDPTSHEAICMDMWYQDENYGDGERLTYDYQRKILDDEGCFNAVLVKGRINKHSFDDISRVHYVLLDMDLYKPMRLAYDLLQDKIVKGGYLLIHDAVPENHLPLIHKLTFKNILKSGKWLPVVALPKQYLVVLERL